MLGKLMKYEIKAVARQMIWVYIAALGVSALFTLACAFSEYLGVAGVIMVTLLTMLYIAAVGGVVICSYIFIMKRIYRSMFSDEGYLTFTLPVKAGTVINSKIFTGALFTLMAYVVIAAMAAVPAVVLIPLFERTVENSELLYIIRELFDALREMFTSYFELDAGKTVVIAVCLIIQLVNALFSMSAVFALSCAIGQLSHKGRAGASVGIFFGITVTFNIIKSIITSLVSFSMVLPDNMGIMDEIILMQNSINGFMTQQIIDASASVLLTAAAWILTHVIVKKKLNLI